MNPTPHMPGSRMDTRPLLQCVLCLRRREQAGGVTQGARFICQGCVVKRIGLRSAA